VAGTLVFIPAWNEAASLPGVLAEARRELPDADLLGIDDGSTDATGGGARAGGAEVVSFRRTAGCGTESPRATAKPPTAATPSADGWTPTASIRRPSWRACSPW
jgi:hypothetical protein